MGIQVYGLSPDDIDSHKAFAEKHGLNYPLLADPEKKLLEALGIWEEKEREGKKYMGATRTTVIIDPDGKMEKIWENVQFQDHAEEVKGFCESLIF